MKSNVPGAISYSDMTAGFHPDSLNSQPPTQSALSSPTNSRMMAPSLREQQLEDRIRSLETHIQHQQERSTAAASRASNDSTEASSKLIKKTEFETITAQQMQLIAELAASNKTANDRMDKQMDLITNLQQTVADLIIQVNDHNSDASTITSNEQRKQRIPHHTSKCAIQRIHPSDAGTSRPINIPPDPGESN